MRREKQTNTKYLYILKYFIHPNLTYKDGPLTKRIKPKELITTLLKSAWDWSHFFQGLENFENALFWQ